MKEQIGADLAAKAGNGRGVKGHAVGECPLELAGHDGDVFLLAVHVAEGQANELHILFLDKLDDLFRGIFHGAYASLVGGNQIPG